MQENTGLMQPIPATEDDIARLFGAPDEAHTQVVARARVYLAARKRKEALEEEAKAANAAFRQAEDELQRTMHACSVPSIAIDDDGRTASLSRVSTTVYSLPAGWQDSPAFIAWIEEAGGMDLCKPSIHHSTFSSFCRELVAQSAQSAGEVVVNPLHPTVVVVERRGIQMRKS